MLILDDICIAKTKGIAAKDVAETGKYPVFGATGLMGYLDTYESENEYVGIIKDGAGVGRTNIYPAKSSLLGTMQYIFPKENIDIKYLMYLLRSLNLGGAAAGAAIPHIYFKNYKKSAVPECDFEKQKLISKLLEKIENLIKLKQKQIFSLDELVKSRFIEMFGDPIKNDKKFSVKKVIDVVTLQRGFDLPVQNRDNTGIIPVYGANGIMGHHNLSKTDYGVITGRSGTLGEVYYSDVPFWPLNTTLFSKDTHGNNLIFLKYLLDFYDLKRFASGAGVPTLNRNEFHSKEIIDVPIELQNTFAEFVKQVDKSKFIVQKQIEDLQELLDSKMDEYFGV